MRHGVARVIRATLLALFVAATADLALDTRLVLSRARVLSAFADTKAHGSHPSRALKPPPPPPPPPLSPPPPPPPLSLSSSATASPSLSAPPNQSLCTVPALYCITLGGLINTYQGMRRCAALARATRRTWLYEPVGGDARRALAAEASDSQQRAHYGGTDGALVGTADVAESSSNSSNSSSNSGGGDGDDSLLHAAVGDAWARADEAAVRDDGGELRFVHGAAAIRKWQQIAHAASILRQSMHDTWHVWLEHSVASATNGNNSGHSGSSSSGRRSKGDSQRAQALLLRAESLTSQFVCTNPLWLAFNRTARKSPSLSPPPPPPPPPPPTAYTAATRLQQWRAPLPPLPWHVYRQVCSPLQRAHVWAVSNANAHSRASLGAAAAQQQQQPPPHAATAMPTTPQVDARWLDLAADERRIFEHAGVQQASRVLIVHNDTSVQRALASVGDAVQPPLVAVLSARQAVPFNEVTHDNLLPPRLWHRAAVALVRYCRRMRASRKPVERLCSVHGRVGDLVERFDIDAGQCANPAQSVCATSAAQLRAEALRHADAHQCSRVYVCTDVDGVASRLHLRSAPRVLLLEDLVGTAEWRSLSASDAALLDLAVCASVDYYAAGVELSTFSHEVRNLWVTRHEQKYGDHDLHSLCDEVARADDRTRTNASAS